MKPAHSLSYRRKSNRTGSRNVPGSFAVGLAKVKRGVAGCNFFHVYNVGVQVFDHLQ